MKLRLLQLGLILVLAACGRSPGAVAQAADLPFTSTPVASFESPWALAFLPKSTRALVTEKPGRVWLVDVATGAKQRVSGAPRVVTGGTGGQGGLLDIAVSPTFAADRFVYLTYSQASGSGGSELALARARLGDGTSPSFQNLSVIWHDPEGGTGGQFGAVIAFAPDRKSLFLSSGERQRFTPAQDPNAPLGKILHLTLDGAPAPGNPLAGRTGAAKVSVADPPEDTEAAQGAQGAQGRSFTWPGPNRTPQEIWSSGHRNPYGLAFAPDGRLWETEMGPRGGDELNLIERGANYGWPLVSEGTNYNGVPIPPHSSRPNVAAPKLYWVPSVSPSNLMFYSGKMFPQWKGSAFIGALSGQALIRVTIAGDQPSKADQWDMGARIRFVGEGPDGAIYLLEDGSGARLLRLTPAARSSS